VTGPGANNRALLLGLVACLAALAVGSFWFKSLYAGVDGVTAVSLIANASPRSAALLPSQISPLQGMGAQQLPVNPWLNPGYAVLLAGNTLALGVGSALVFAGALLIAVYLLGTALGVGPALSLAAAQATCLLLFPPLETNAGFYVQVRINPGVVLYVAIAIALIALLIRCGTLRPAASAAVALAIPALFVYSVLCDPIWTVVPYLSLWVFFAAALLADRTPRTDRWRGGVVLLGAGALTAAGVPAYLWTLLRYTARARFDTEIVGEVQDRLYAFLPFQNPRMALLFALLLAGVLLALRGRERRVRLFAAACLAHMALLTGLSLVYLFGDVNWTYPLPAYLQLPSFPVYLLVSAAGWRDGASALLRRAPRLAGALRLPNRLSTRPALAAAVVPAVGLLLIVLKASTMGKETRLFQTGVLDFLGTQRSSHPFALRLEERLAARPGAPFRGSFAAAYPKDDSRSAAATLASLLSMNVPSLEEYSQLVSPQFYYLVTRGLGSPEDGPASRNSVRVTVPRVNLLRALGVRYLWSWPGGAAPVAGLARKAMADGDGCFLYELPDPNVGSYSPVRVIRSRSAAETVALLVSPGVDLRRDVVLADPVDGPLVPARDASLRFADGGVFVSAKSDGRSLLLLPVQFSHALRARTKRGDVRLVRANLAQTGLLFDREVDAFLTLDFGIGRTRGRAQDLADLDLLGIGEDGTRRVTPELHDRLHPYARIRR
jgi:hypothetical protein